MDEYSGSTSAWDYLDFELEIREGVPREYPVSVRSPAGEALAQMRFPYDQWELKDRLQSLEIALLRSGGTRRRIASPEEHTVQDFGRGLFEALLVGDVRTRYEMSLSEARRQGKGLRLKLRIQPSELAVLPWEFLYDAERDRYPCLSSNTPLVRYLDLPQPVEPLSVSPPLRVLGMVTSPAGLAPLDVGHEKRLVEEATRGLREGGMLELTWLEGQTWRHLQRALRRGPWHVFHFIGHGGFDAATEEGALALSDDAGRMNLLRARGLAELLDDHYHLRLVFLNSCEGARGSESDAFSSTAATLVRRGVPAVVAMQYEITDGAAIEFSRDFYEALADSLPVDAAVTEARAAVSMDSALEWGTPVLYMHSPDGRVFDVAATSTGDHPAPETGDHQEEDPARTYREAVESAWGGGALEAEEARRLKDLAYDTLALSPETAAGIERDVTGQTVEAILERQEQAARQEQRNRRLAGLYAEAGRLHRERNWQAVVDVFEKIRAEAPHYGDPEELLASSREALEQEQELAALYERGVRCVEDEEWQQAIECFEEVRRVRPDYKDTEKLLSRARGALPSPSMVIVPDLTGVEVYRARRILTGRHLTIGSQRTVSSESMLEGEIVEHHPERGTRVVGGSRVDIAVSSGARRTTKTAHGESGERAARRGSVRSPLPTSVGSWWVMVLRGLAMGVFGLALLVSFQALSGEFRLFGSLLLLAESVLATIDAKTNPGRRRLMLTQGLINGLLGVLLLLVWLVQDSSVLSQVRESYPVEPVTPAITAFIQDTKIALRLVGAWALIVGTIRTLAAFGHRRETNNMLLLGTSGVLLVICGILFWFHPDHVRYPAGLALFASGGTLVAFALRMWFGQGGRVRA